MDWKLISAQRGLAIQILRMSLQITGISELLGVKLLCNYFLLALSKLRYFRPSPSNH